jgi:hypothetical protein
VSSVSSWVGVLQEGKLSMLLVRLQHSQSNEHTFECQESLYKKTQYLAIVVVLEQKEIQTSERIEREVIDNFPMTKSCRIHITLCFVLTFQKSFTKNKCISIRIVFILSTTFIPIIIITNEKILHCLSHHSKTKVNRRSLTGAGTTFTS